MKRHRWDRATDVCKDCGIYRSGCSAGHMGFMSYYRDGKLVGFRAGPCEPTDAGRAALARAKETRR